MDQWEKMALDRSQWRKLIHAGIESFEKNRVQYAAYKRPVHKEQHQVYKVTTSTVKYVENSVSHLLVLKVICAIMSNLLSRIKIFM